MLWLNILAWYVTDFVVFVDYFLSSHADIHQVHIVLKELEATLLSSGKIVYQSIVKDPAAWLDFSHRIKSKPLFKEALIHAVGQYNSPNMIAAMEGNMRPAIHELIQRKANAMKSGVQMVTNNILTYYPKHIQRARSTGLAEVDNTTRNSYGNDIITWMALSVFRQWFSQQVVAEKTLRAQDMGYETFSAMSKGGDEYLHQGSLGDFHRIFPMSYKGGQTLMNKLFDVKEHVKHFVEVSLSGVKLPA